MQIKPTEYARKDGVNMISFQPRPSYWLDIEEICNEEYNYEDDDLQDYCDDEEYDRDC